MKAMIWSEYGSPDVIKLQEIPKPIPKDNEILVKIHSTTVTSGDCEMRSMKTALFFRILMRLYTGLRKPKRIIMLGMELAGEIIEIGDEVNLFKKGDQIFAALSYENIGTYAEYKCIPQDSVIAIKPENMTYEEATTIPVGGLEAYHYIRQAEIQQGREMLINGAAGTIGIFALQLAKGLGAKVTAVDSTEKLVMLNSLGADRTIDYNKQDFTEDINRYDIILDIVGKRNPSESMRVLKDGGIYIVVSPGIFKSLKARLHAKIQNKKVKFKTPSFKLTDLLYLREKIEAGKLRTIIDKQFLLEDAPTAHRYVESGNKVGHVVLKIGD
ncbi:MAG: zinc-binding dehydrogenase [Candidatus Lokiarchaeota archaeon]|nr:zinc-binding dehydrogenase [Candidatus Lokiarchaeota archaeon]MBD3201141.1 zinc-binding dehydrogenase [Candidatus Lokiarchaeota archaeon]